MAWLLEAAGFRHLGKDDRGWAMFLLDKGNKTFDVTIMGKRLVVAQQEQPMKVYVNPDPALLDECEVPPDSGMKFTMDPS